MLTDMCDLVPDPRLILQKHPSILFLFMAFLIQILITFRFCPITIFSSEILLLPTVVNQMNGIASSAPLKNIHDITKAIKILSSLCATNL